MKTLKIICLAFFVVLVSSGICLAEQQEQVSEYDAEYTGRIVTVDKNFAMVKVDNQEKYSIMRILDKQGFLVDGDIVEGKLYTRLARKVVIADITQESKFVGKVEYRENSWEEIYRWWDIRYDMRYFN